MRCARFDRGSALGSTFLIILFLVIFALTLTNLATFDLRTVTRDAERQLALNAAETGLETVMAEMALDPTVGKANEDLSGTLADGSSYAISFDSSGTSLYSVNNLDQLTGVPGALGRTVPPFHAHLLAQGTSPQGEVSNVECLFRLEAIPYAVAGTGEIELQTTQVAGSDTLTGAASPTQTGSVYSGAPGAGSTRLQGLTNITGDARSAGGISVSGGASVAGDVEPNHTPETLPNLVVTDFDNGGEPLVDLQLGGVHAAPFLSGEVNFSGPTELTGIITLADANVYVSDDLTINGIVVGRGTFFVNGETNFLTTINLSGNSRLTLFSNEDINFNAPVPLPNVIQGVLYTHGSVNTAPLAPLTVLGAIYAVAPTDPSAGNVTLRTGSLVVHVVETTTFASSFLARNGGANPVRVYWSQFP